MPAIALEDEDEPTWVTIPDDLLIQQATNPIKQIVDSTYPDLLTRYDEVGYICKRAILAPTNDIVDKINSYILSSLPSEIKTLLSADRICPSTASFDEQSALYPSKFLNTFKFSGIPNHALELKVGVPIILLHNKTKVEVYAIEQG